MLMLSGHISATGMFSHTPDTLWEAMRNPAFYPHTTHNIQVIHTHISTIFLTGEFAYKIKKPVNFGFLDFTRLADRKRFCEKEVRLNSRFAPNLYLGVMPILQTNGAYCLGNDSTGNPADIVEYAVKMRQFDPTQQLDCLLAAGQLPLEQMDTLARRLARFHQQAEPAPADSHFGDPASVVAPMQQNFALLYQKLGASAPIERLHTLENWTQQEYSRLYAQLQQRKQGGHIRACHGDMHLGNIALIEGEITFFDGIEFNDELRWIDTASDCAFLLMDLEDRGKPVWARRLLNLWLQETGDYPALPVITFYKVYRALVRAKVQALRLAQVADGEGRSSILHRCAEYLELAAGYTQRPPPALIITHGLSGSGKSWGCATLAEQLGFIQIRSDVERKRLAGMQADDRQPDGLDQGIYTADMTLRTYDRLAGLSSLALQSGHCAVVDATFLQAEQRQRFQQLARQHQAAFLILHFEATPAQMEANIARRQRMDNDASDADIAVLHKQLSCYKALQDDEPYVTVRINERLPLERVQAQLGHS